MKLWIDAQLPPTLARWITEHFEGIEAFPARELGLRDAEDAEMQVILSSTLSAVVALLQQGERLKECDQSAQWWLPHEE